jgi:hypothetical protein
MSGGDFFGCKRPQLPFLPPAMSARTTKIGPTTAQKAARLNLRRSLKGQTRLIPCVYRLIAWIGAATSMHQNETWKYLEPAVQRILDEVWALAFE